MDYKNLLLLKGFNLNVYDEGVFWELEISKEVTTSYNGETITLYDGKIKELCKLFGAQVDIDTDSFTDVNTVILQCKHDFTECVFCYDGNALDVSTEEFMKCINNFHNDYAGYISKAEVIDLVYQLTNDYLHTNINETDGDTSYNCGFKDALTGVRNYIRREIENL